MWDIAGSRFEWSNIKSKGFTLLVWCGEDVDECCFTDDMVMTVAIAEAIFKWRKGGDKSYEALSLMAIKSMQKFGRRYPNAGYGGTFQRWLRDDNPRPYNSWGNGAAMRVSACGWAGQSIDEVKAMSRAVTKVHTITQEVSKARRLRLLPRSLRVSASRRMKYAR